VHVIRANHCEKSGTEPFPYDCPVCGKGGTFEPIGFTDIALVGGFAGHRKCPNPNCHAYLFFLRSGNEMQTVPASRIGFETKNIPEEIVSNLSEAITCHSQGCYRASAIMVRRSLEVLCQLQGASGSDLFQRIEALRGKVTLPKDFFDGLHDLRLLGNDAAHLESKIFAEIGENEIRLAIDVTKEFLKAIYQYNDLVERLRSLKKTTP
jgi:hypothetical protein